MKKQSFFKRNDRNFSRANTFSRHVKIQTDSDWITSCGFMTQGYLFQNACLAKTRATRKPRSLLTNEDGTLSLVMERQSHAHPLAQLPPRS